MIFILLTFLSALAIEGLGTLVSVIGLSALFGSNPIIIALVVALDLGKLVSVSLLYTHWRDLPKLMKGYALIAAMVLMTITSTGAAGYLSSEFQRAIVGTQEGSLKVDVLKKQQAKYEERKKQIDDQVAAIPGKYTANQRIRVTNQFKAEQKDLQDKINQIDKDLPALQVSQISTEAHAGPILYIAKAFDVTVEVAVKYVILLIIFVFDPLAIFLIIAGNFLVAKRRKGQVYGDIIHYDEDEPPNLPVMARTESIVQELKPSSSKSEEPGENWWAEQNARAAEMKRRREIQDRDEAEQDARDLATANHKAGMSGKLPAVESPEVLPELAPIVEEFVLPIEEPVEPPRESITLSTLGLAPAPQADPLHHVTSFGNVQPDPHTVVDASQIDQVTPFRTEFYPRPTKKRPTR